MLALASLLLALAAPEPPAPQPPGLLAPGNYAYLSPGIGGLVPVPDVGIGAYAWSLGAGRYFTAKRRLAVALGGFLEHQVLLPPPRSPLVCTFAHRPTRAELDAFLDQGGWTFADDWGRVIAGNVLDAEWLAATGAAPWRAFPASIERPD